MAEHELMFCALCYISSLAYSYTCTCFYPQIHVYIHFTILYITCVCTERARMDMYNNDGYTSFYCTYVYHRWLSSGLFGVVILR